MVFGYPTDDEPGRHAVPDPVVPETPRVFEATPEPVTPVSEPIVVTTPEKFGIPWKSIVGFLTVFVGQLIARATAENGTAVLPDTAGAWGALIGGSLLAAALIWIKGNTYTIAQAEVKLEKAKDRNSA